MLIQTARGRLIGGGVILLLFAAIFGWWSVSYSPTPVQSIRPETTIPAVSPIASMPSEAPSLSDQTKTPEPAPGPRVAQDAPPALSPADVTARAKVDDFPAEREAILAELEGQSLEETISQALHVWPSDAFTTGFSRGSPYLNERQKYLLQDPRLAKILHAAVNGTDEERAAIRSQVMQIVDKFLAERQKRDEGLAYDESLVDIAPGKEVYLMILAEVDTDGTTLPLLLKWYEADRGPAWSEAELQALDQRTMSVGGRPGKTNDAISGDVLSVASAAQLITRRMGNPLLECEDMAQESLGDSTYVFPGGKFNVRVVDELKGYSLFETIFPPETDELMDTLRARLLEPVSGQGEF